MSPCCAAGLDPTDPVQGLLLFGTGLAISAGHCGGMCGPLLTAFGVARGKSRTSRRDLAVATLAYHFGRVATYAALGAVLAASGSFVRSAYPAVDLRPLVSLAVGLALAVPAVSLLHSATTGSVAGTTPVAALLRRLSFAARPLRRLGPGGLGAANGLLPCGPVAIVALGAASAGDPGRGALSLATFGLGTLPLLAALTFGAATIRLRPRPALVRAGSVLLLALAVQLSLRGLAGFGLVPHAEVGPWPLW
jgi:sulfite exporter TauE/SafE